MDSRFFLDRLRRGRAGLALAGIFSSLLLVGCPTGAMMGGATGTLTQDIFEIKTLLRDLEEQIGQNKRATDVELSDIKAQVADNNRQIKTVDQDVDRGLNQSARDSQDVIKKLDALSFQVDSLATKLDMQSASMSDRSRTLLEPAEPGRDAYDEGHRLYNVAQYVQAAESFQQAIALGVGEELGIQSRYWLAECQKNQGKLEEAYGSYSEVILTDNRHARAWVSLERMAAIEEQRNNFDQAYVLYGQIAEKLPDYDGIERVRQRMMAIRPRLTIPPRTP